MAQTKKKRQRKRRGTQGGRIDNKPRGGRPRSRAEAQARARQGGRKPSGPKQDLPPTWKGSAVRGLAAAAIFFVALLLLFKRPVGVAAAFAGFMLVFYIPSGYYIDTALWRRRERKRIREREGL
jgi:hypothetical protein